MRTKDEITGQLKKGVTMVYESPPWERKKDSILIEVLIDIRDELDDLNKGQRGLYDYKIMGQ